MWEQNKGKLHQYVGCKWGKGNCYPKLTKRTNDIQPGRLPFTRNSISEENRTLMVSEEYRINRHKYGEI